MDSKTSTNVGASIIEWLVIIAGIFVYLVTLVLVMSPLILLLALAYWLVKSA